MADFSSMPYGQMVRAMPYTPTQPYNPSTGYSGSNPFTTAYGGPAPTGADGMPMKPEFQSIGDVNTGLLQAPYQISSQLNSSGLNALENEALRTGPSAWRNLAQGQAYDQLAKSGASNLMSAQNNLAMSGGLTSGARERLANNAMTSGLTARQNAFTNLAIGDEQKRMAALSALPGQQLQQAQYLTGVQGQNVGNALNELTQKRMSDTANYSEAMKAWAAGKMADAIPAAAASGGLLGMGGLLGTGIGGPGGVLGTGFAGGGFTSGGITGKGIVGDVMTAPISAPIAIGKSIGIGGGK